MQCTVSVVVGVSAAACGFIEAAALLTVSPALGQDDFNLLSIAVVVIGGTSLRGGRASIIGTLAGTAGSWLWKMGFRSSDCRRWPTGWWSG